MSQEFQQHWLSAYLDEELSSDERALVERRLEEDAEARQLLEDLKRVRSLVATLPGWPGANFQFDMSRLSEPEPVDDDHDLLNEQSVGGTTASMNQDVEARGPVDPGWKPGLRGLLALAAGVLLLILCVPLFLQRNAHEMAVGMRAPESDFSSAGGGGGMMGGMGSAADIEGSADAFAAASNMAPAPMLPPAAPANGPADPRQAGGGRDAGSPPGAAGAAGVSNTLAPTGIAESQSGAAGGMGGGMASRAAKSAGADFNSAEQAKESLDRPANSQRGGFAPGPTQAKKSAALPAELAETKPASMEAKSVDLSSESFLCAKSEAWSETDVQQALPQLFNYVSENSLLADAGGQRGSKSKEVESDAASRGSVKLEEMSTKALGQTQLNELLVGDLPKTADVTNWFAQIQMAQPLTPLKLSSTLQKADRVDQDRGRLAEPPALSKGDRQVQPAAPSPASAKGERRPDVAKPAPPANALNFDASAGLGAVVQETAQGDAPRQRLIVLFVTEAEAQKIRASVLGRAAVNLLRVPTQLGGQVKQNSAEKADKKVIVILNRP